MVEQLFRSATLEAPDKTLNKVKVIAYAPLPELPVEARKGFKFLVAVVFSLILAFVVAGFVDNLDHSIRKREQVEEQLGVPHLASIGSHRV
jgi:capsular polysaccharide biosynthesis protein